MDSFTGEIRKDVVFIKDNIIKRNTTITHFNTTLFPFGNRQVFARNGSKIQWYLVRVQTPEQE